MDASPIDPPPPESAPSDPLPPPPTLPRRIRRRSPLVAGILGWAMPGFGQLYGGRPGKALLMLLTIGGLFYGGLAMTGFTAVDPYTYGLEFVAHAWIGGPTAWAYWNGQGILLTEAMPHLEVGRLYVAVAGLLNIVAICDALGVVLRHNVRAEERAVERERLLRAHEQAIARIEAGLPSAAEPVEELELDVDVELEEPATDEPPTGESTAHETGLDPTIDWASREERP